MKLSNTEQEYVLQALQQGLRDDGRGLDEFRACSIVLGSEPGVVNVSLGKTRVECKISASITKPYEDRPVEGVFMINSDITPLAGAQYDMGGSTDDEILLARVIEKAVRRSRALDLENLCIIAGEKCWTVRADLHFLDFDGGFIDASCVAVMTALQHYKRPEVSVQGQQVIVHPADERPFVGLSVLHVPLCVTFSFYDVGEAEESIKGETGKEFCVLDATATEEACSRGSLTLTLNKNKEICQISKSGGLPLDAAVLLDCTGKAIVVVEKLSEQIKQVLSSAEKSGQGQ